MIDLEAVEFVQFLALVNWIEQLSSLFPLINLQQISCTYAAVQLFSTINFQFNVIERSLKLLTDTLFLVEGHANSLIMDSL